MIKKLIYIIIIFGFFQNICFAQSVKGTISLNKKSNKSVYSDSIKALNTADYNFQLYKKSTQSFQKKIYLEQAMRFYYIANKIDNALIDAHIGLALVYDELKLDRLAKKSFFQALNVNPKDLKANYFFADYYFKRDDYLTALKYYEIAYMNGAENNFEVNYKLGIIYEKLADIKMAVFYYTKALKLKPNDNILFEKIRLLDELNYDDSQYYLFDNKK